LIRTDRWRKIADFQNVKQAGLASPAPTEGGATATPVAVSNHDPFSPRQDGSVLGESTTPPVAQPLVLHSGLSVGDLDARLAALQQSFQSELAAVGTLHHESLNIYRSIGMVAEDASEPLTDADIPTALRQATTCRYRVEPSQELSPVRTSRSPAR
jgi:hypothetical protein